MSRCTSPLDLVTSEIVGPSSSHTTGVMRIGMNIREKTGPITLAKITLYNSLADTGDAHMTRAALIAGLLGWNEEDPRIPFSFSYTEEARLKIKWSNKRDEEKHPNTVLVDTEGKTNRSFIGVSVGGGRYTLKEIPP